MPLLTQAQSQSHTGKEIWEHGNPATEEAEWGPKGELDRQVRGCDYQHSSCLLPRLVYQGSTILWSVSWLWIVFEGTCLAIPYIESHWRRDSPWCIPAVHHKRPPKENYNAPPHCRKGNFLLFSPLPQRCPIFFLLCLGHMNRQE